MENKFETIELQDAGFWWETIEEFQEWTDSIIEEVKYLNDKHKTTLSNLYFEKSVYQEYGETYTELKLMYEGIRPLTQEEIDANKAELLSAEVRNNLYYELLGKNVPQSLANNLAFQQLYSEGKVDL